MRRCVALFRRFAAPLTTTTPPPSSTTTCRAEGASIFRVERRQTLAVGGGGLCGGLSGDGADGADGEGAPAAAAAAAILEDVTFAAPVRVLFWKRWARTTMRQASRLEAGGARVGVDFALVHSVRRWWQ